MTFIAPYLSAMRKGYQDINERFQMIASQASLSIVYKVKS